MKKSLRVSTPLLSAVVASALAAGCGGGTPQPTHARACVDNQGKVWEESKCAETTPRATGGGAFVPFYHWYYYPYRYGSYAPGMALPPAALREGSAVAPAGGSYRATGGSVARPSGSVGGFGSTGAGASGGG